MTNSSPHSSDEATHHDTPSTNLTAFSPETVHTYRSKKGKEPMFNFRVTTDGNASVASIAANSRINDDVFLAACGPIAGTQLSPTAQAFTPGQYGDDRTITAFSAGNNPRMLVGTTQTSVGGQGRLRNIASGPSDTPLSLEALRLSSVADTPTYNHQLDRDAIREVGAIGDERSVSSEEDERRRDASLRQMLEDSRRCSKADNATFMRIYAEIQARAPEPPARLLRNFYIRDGDFTNEMLDRRGFSVSGVWPTTSFAELHEAFTIATQYGSIKGINALGLRHSGQVLVSFADIRDAIATFNHVKRNVPAWKPMRLNPTAYAERCDMYSNPGYTAVPVSNYDGQVLVTLFFDGRLEVPTLPTYNLMRDALSAFGDIKAIGSFPLEQGNVREFRVEFFDTRAAEIAVASLQGIPLGDAIVNVDKHEPDLVNIPPTDNMLQPRVSREELSLTGRSTLPASENSRLLVGLKRANDAFSRAGLAIMPRNNPVNHNQVDVDRINEGLDVRTTIMLRNIPNKITQAMLKELIDESSLGDYDFMYLRIDFANNCKYVQEVAALPSLTDKKSVGYAFINFVDAQSIIPFAEKRAGKRWNKFHSDKVAEISYATIQGKDCLVSKFRNSSVMMEDPTFRPKLFVTGNGPDAGQEEEFPGPDNHSKMRRSLENAEHVGLFNSRLYGNPRTPRPSPNNHARPVHYAAGPSTLYRASLPARAAAPARLILTPPTPTPVRLAFPAAAPLAACVASIPAHLQKRKDDSSDDEESTLPLPLPGWNWNPTSPCLND